LLEVVGDEEILDVDGVSPFIHGYISPGENAMLQTGNLAKFSLQGDVGPWKWRCPVVPSAAVRIVPDEDEVFQSPTLSEDELAWADTAMAQRRSVEWLMAPEAPESQMLADLFHRPAWMTRAACRGVGTEGFIVDKGGRHTRLVCEGCEVRAECLETALADSELVDSGEGPSTASAGRCGGGVRWRS
jgi:hypothetical protein